VAQEVHARVKHTHNQYAGLGLAIENGVAAAFYLQVARANIIDSAAHRRKLRKPLERLVQAAT